MIKNSHTVSETHLTYLLEGKAHLSRVKQMGREYDCSSIAHSVSYEA
jgi:hypothetical protein